VLLEAAPEVADRALDRCEAIDDEHERTSALSLLVGHLDAARARRACAWMVERASALGPGEPRWAERWEVVLEALTEAGCTSLLDEGARRALVDALPPEAAPALLAATVPFVPDDRVAAMLERSYAGLAAADHYTTREAWIAVGLPLLARAPTARSAAWLEVAAEQIALTGIDGAGRERLAAWSPAQQRAIVLARLAQHQRRFLPTWLLQPWLRSLAPTLPPRLRPGWEAWLDADSIARVHAGECEGLAFPGANPRDREAACRELERRTAGTAWPSFDEVSATFAALGRCAGERAVTAAAAALADLLRRSLDP
jgi:hypothetical protein